MAEQEKNCTWTYDDDDDAYNTDCEQCFCFTEGTPADNNVRFCHYCGQPVVVVMPTPPEDDEANEDDNDD